MDFGLSLLFFERGVPTVFPFFVGIVDNMENWSHCDPLEEGDGLLDFDLVGTLLRDGLVAGDGRCFFVVEGDRC